MLNILIKIKLSKRDYKTSGGNVVLDILVEMDWSTLFISVKTALFATVISFPLMYRSTRGAFEQIEMNIIYAAQTLGMSNRKIFWKIIIPSAKPGILSGIILTFARALGEYGATSMLAGNISGKTSTISQVIAMVMKDGDYLKAGIWVVIIMMFAFCIVSVMNLIPEKKKAVQMRWK